MILSLLGNAYIQIHKIDFILKSRITYLIKYR